MTQKIWKKFSFFFFISITLFPLQLSANQLKILMFNSEFCMFCSAWERDIGTLFEKSDYAGYFELTRHHISQQDQINFSLNSPVIGTPTFIIVGKNREIGRISGYSGSEMFWWQLSEFLPNHK